MRSRRRPQRQPLLCGFLADSPNTFIKGLCASLGAGWDCCSEDECWRIYNPESELEFVVDCCDDEYDVECNFGLAKSGCDYPTACNWVQEKLASFNRISQLILTTSMNSAINRDECAIIKAVFKAAEDAVVMPEGFRYRSFRENTSENTVIGTLEYKGNWVTKSSLAADFEDQVWTFCPNYDPEGHGTNREASGYSNLDVRWQDRAYQMTVNPNSSVPAEKQIMFQLVQHLQDGVDAIIHDPPPRLYPLFWKDGIMDDKDLTRISKRGALNLVKQNVLPGRKLIKSRPELWRELFEGGYITEEDVVKTNPDKLLWLVKQGKLPPERAIKADPSLADKLRKAGITLDDSDVEFESEDAMLQAVRDGMLTPQKAWSLRPRLLKTMIEEGLITPDDAYRLDPKILNWMLINHHVGRAWANQRKPEARTKSELKKQGVDWDSLDAAKHRNRR